MSQDSFGPHFPEPGYRTRWPKQALALLGRSPLALVALAGFGLLSLAPSLLLGAVLNQADIPTGVLRIILNMTAVPALGLAMMICLAIYLREDLGTDLDPRRLGVSLPSVMTIIFLVNGSLLVVSMLLSSGTSDQVMTPGEETIGSALLILLAFLSTMMSASIVAAAIFSPFLLAGIVGAGMGLTEILQVDHAMRARMFGLHMEIFIFTILLTVLASLSGPFGVLVHAFALAWLYVVAREIIGGISKNSSRETREQVDAVPEAG